MESVVETKKAEEERTSEQEIIEINSHEGREQKKRETIEF